MHLNSNYLVNITESA